MLANKQNRRKVEIFPFFFASTIVIASIFALVRSSLFTAIISLMSSYLKGCNSLNAFYVRHISVIYLMKDHVLICLKFTTVPFFKILLS